jgi:PAS domain S-box-containing protein
VAGNENFARSFGTQSADLVGKSDYDFFPRDLAEQYRAEDERVMLAGQGETLENKILVDGREVWELVVKIPLRNEQGEVTGVFGSLWDITERKRAEAEIASALSLLESTMEATADGMLVVNGQGGIVRTNAKFRTLWGLPESLLAANDDEAALQFVLGQLQEPDAFLTQVRALYATSEATSYDVLELKDGRVFERYSQPQRLDQAVVGRVWSFRDITERRQSEEKLITIMKAVESTSDAVGISDAKGRHFFQNKALSALFGYATAEELQAAGGGPVVVKDPAVAKQMFESIMGGKSWAGELEMVTRSGRVFPAYERADAVLDNDGKVIGLIGIITDITERQQAAAAFKEQSAQLQSLFDNAPVGIFHSTPKGRLLAVNPALARMLGHASPEELIAATADMTTQIYADPPRRSQIVHDLLGSDGWFHYDEVAWLRKDGGQITVDITGRRVLNATGSLAYLEGFVEDITERQQAQKNLAAAAVFHLQILKNAPALIWRSGTDALCGWFNDTWLEFTGRTMEQEMGNGWAEGVHPEDFARCLNIYQEAFAARRDFAMDYRLRHHSGEYRWISGYGTPFKDLSGNFGGFIGYCFDITERRQAEERINALVEMVNAAPLSIVVHDFSGQLLYANPSTFALHQYSEPEFMALNLHALDVPESKALIQARMDQIVQTGQASFEVGHFRKDGSVVPLELLVKQVSWRGQPALLSIGRDITERRQTAAALAASEERHRLLLQYLPVGVVVHQADTAITLANAAASRLLGLTLDQLQGRVAIDPAWRFLRSDEHPMPVDEYPVARVLATGRPLEGFVVGIYRPVSGDRVWVLVNAFPQFDAAGKVWQVEVTFIDITARKLAEEAALQAQARAQELLAMAEISAQQLRQAQAETEASLAQTRRANQSLLGVLEDNQAAHKALSEAQALLQTAMDCSPAGIAIADAPDGRLRYVNRAGLGIRGGSEGELVTNVDINKYVASWQILDLHGLPLPPEEVPLAWAIQKGEPHSREFIIRRAADDDRIVLGNAAPVRNAAGKVIAGIVVFIDITERKRAEAALRMGEARFQEFMSHLPAAVFIKDVFGRTIFANRYFQNLPAWQGKTMSQLLAGQGAQRMTEDDLRALVGKPVEAEEKLPAAAGADRVFKTIKFAILVPEQPAMLGGIALDITSLKDAEEEVRRLNQGLEQRVKDRTAQLEASNRELEAFSYSVSHDLRAPLRAINGYARLLHKGHASHLDAEGLRVLGVVSSEAQRMGTLIDDLLAFSRLGRQPVKRSTVNLQNLAKSVFADLAAAAPERGLRLTLSADVPPVSADPALLRQVLVNLLGNAVKYTRPVAAPLIELGSRVEGEETIYFVRDNGVGFDMKYVGKLFGVFQRLHSEAEFEGTGVGLALAQRIIHRHGGRIWADSKLGEGAIFSFTLPLAKVEI